MEKTVTVETTANVTIGELTSSVDPTTTKVHASSMSTSSEPEMKSDVWKARNDGWNVTADAWDNTTDAWYVTTEAWNGTIDAWSGTTEWTFNNNGTLTSRSSSEEWVWSPVSWPWWQIVQFILAVVGIIGNFLVMLILFRQKRHSYSTDTLIAALAAADFTTSISILPHPRATTLPDTPTGQVYCRIIHSSVIMWISICASIFTLTTISVERLLAIRYPFTFQRMFTPRRSVLVIVVIWLVAVAINSYSLYIHFVQDGTCVTIFPTALFQKIIGVTLFLVEYVIPVIIMLTAHALTIHSLRQRASPVTVGQERQKHALKLMKARHRVLQMLFIVVITFIICWTPDQFGFLVFNLGVVDFTHLFSPLYRAFVVLAFANSCLNPIIYASRNLRFRKALGDLFKGVCTPSGQSVFAGFEDDDDSKEMNTGATDVPTNDQSQV
ncbi:galanin receptor type 2-like [Strongylocentrotus purpuratus]|uniref:G-protein coupled receptors family 1 profile domain-containing protein n=1 Tax=Strongylocentrotus purpuratus TaxID=7668 RepID=A0A7M7GI25_STRPU|nr:galanin receptor type 2-like [Strongylocentrotus purpuratus]XP_030830628.1 galanin receptor type 2-like [Strongylocentrotus purpuratus]|eukprot:XP_003728645.1 PREDICTED: galanin receptor type 2-like [Strongylocentrotus purpuratus]